MLIPGATYLLPDGTRVFARAFPSDVSGPLIRLDYPDGRAAFMVLPAGFWCCDHSFFRRMIERGDALDYEDVPCDLVEEDLMLELLPA